MLDKIIRQIHLQLKVRNKTIAIAESCTGGQLCSLLTSLPGASDYFLLGAITYSNKSKEEILKIPEKMLIKYGAVSRPVAVLMAKNIRKKAAADIGLSITGIAGPGGATKNKPVGTVYISLSTKHKNTCRKFNFQGNRRHIRKASTQSALRLLCAYLSQ
jgi:PncC family amidohydrolase